MQAYESCHARKRGKILEILRRREKARKRGERKEIKTRGRGRKGKEEEK